MTDFQLCMGVVVVALLFALAVLLTRMAAKRDQPSEAKQRKRQPYWSWWMPPLIAAGLAFQAAVKGEATGELVFSALINLCIYGLIFGVVGAAFRVPVEDD